MTVNRRTLTTGPYDFFEEHIRILSGQTPHFDEMNSFLGGDWTPSKLVTDLRRMIVLAKHQHEAPAAEGSEDEPGSVAFWRARAVERADGIDAIIERAGTTTDEAVVAGYLAGLAQAFLYHLVVPQPSHRRTVSDLAGYGLERERDLAAGGKGAAKARTGWEAEGLALARQARNADPYVSSDAIAGRIEALFEGGQWERSKETILKRIRDWEKFEGLPRRLSKTRQLASG